MRQGAFLAAGPGMVGRLPRAAAGSSRPGPKPTGLRSLFRGPAGSRGSGPSRSCTCLPRPLHRCRGGPVACLGNLPPRLPQNTENPQVVPSPSFSAEECVRVQLEALRQNDVPWSNHGVQTAYEFAAEVGGLDRAPYFFGSPLDLYHLDHFQGKFLNKLPELVGCSSFSIDSVEERAGEECPSHVVAVSVKDRNGARAAFRFLLTRKRVGLQKGALITHVIERASP